MKFRIPFTISDIEKIKRKPIIFRFPLKNKKKSWLNYYLENSDTEITREQYLNVVVQSFFVAFIILFVISTTALALFGVGLFYVWSFLLSLLFSVFVFFSQIIYPKIFVSRKDKDIERNLISALEDMLVQFSSGIPLFSIIVNVSISQYGVLSDEFKKIAMKINAGLPQVEVLEETGEKSSSIFFRRTLWQISNGMKAGSDISVVISDSINSLNQEQLVQIQNYGNKLNPLIMFYMLISVILPALAITFLTIISSLINLPEFTTTLLYFGLFVMVILIQIMFLGVIRSSRPSLL